MQTLVSRLRRARRPRWSSRCCQSCSRPPLAGNWTQQWTTLRNLVGLLVRLGAYEAAAVLYGAQEAAATAGAVFGADADRLADIGRTLQARLGPEPFGDAIARGQALTDDEAVAFASAAIDQALRTESNICDGRTDGGTMRAWV